jgi:hypothetical protein
MLAAFRTEHSVQYAFGVYAIFSLQHFLRNLVLGPSPFYFKIQAVYRFGIEKTLDFFETTVDRQLLSPRSCCCGLCLPHYSDNTSEAYCVICEVDNLKV